MLLTSWDQKQKFVDVLQNTYSSKFRNIHRETPVLKSSFNKVAALTLFFIIHLRWLHFIIFFQEWSRLTLSFLMLKMAKYTLKMHEMIN